VIIIGDIPARLRARRLGVRGHWRELDAAVQLGRILGSPTRIALAAASIEIHAAQRAGRDIEWRSVANAVRRAATRTGLTDHRRHA
jgi:uncharacterized iron-regulated membrane protein